MEGTSKTNLGKSKSSNSASPTKSKHNEQRTKKKSKSNAHFQPNVCKKRGVYVDNNSLSKHTKSALVEQNTSTQKKRSQEKRVLCKAPPIPRPGKKRFLNSVLAILSKTTTSTQYPFTEKEIKNKDKNIISTTQRKLTKQTFEDGNINHIDKKSVKTNKFKSKVLNQRTYSKEKDSLVCLQPKRDLIQTPSNFSERSSKLSTISHMIYSKMNSINNVEAGICSPKGNIAREVIEGRNYNQTKNVDSPVTLVNNMREKPQDDKKFYDFFVDLLETTFNVYNVKPEYDNVQSDVSSSKIALEIHESVEKKLNIKKQHETQNDSINLLEDVTETTSSNFQEDEVLPWNDKKFQDYFTCQQSMQESHSEKTQPKIYKKKIRSGSFIHPSSIPKGLETHSAILNTKKKYSRKNRKKDLLNMFKEQLTMEAHAFDEPMNFYESLKVMARNKRKCQKTIKFQEPVKRKPKLGSEPECKLKRRKVLSNAKSKIKYPDYDVDSDFPESLSKSSSSGINYYSKKKSNKSEYSTEHEADNESLKSLEVFGYDYEPTEAKRRLANRNKQILYTHDNKTSDDVFINRSHQHESNVKFEGKSISQVLSDFEDHNY